MSATPLEPVEQTAAWAALAAHHAALFGATAAEPFDLRRAFARDGGRFAALSVEAPEVFADLSKQLWTPETLRLLLALAEARGVAARRDAMFAGEPINAPEGRAVLHTALRAPRGAATPHNAEVHAVLDAMGDWTDALRADEAITDLVNIGIGGSDLGPAMATRALEPWRLPRLRLHFVSNVDGHDIAPLLARLDARRTVFVIASKTFTTQETMANATAARAWFDAQTAGEADVARHFVGVTTNLQAAAAFGITRTFGFWDWVGGRYSLWGAIGLPLMAAIGRGRFAELLAGAFAMDRHFASARPEANLPLLLGLLDVWCRNFLGCASRSVAPYHQGLARLPAYLQQLEMESNGKRVALDGAPLAVATSPVVWGEPGTNGQHAFFQMLHQGSDLVPVEFIAARRASHDAMALPPALREALADQHRKLLANCLAQGQALMLGQDEATATALPAPTAAPDYPREALARHRHFPGNRPSSTLLLDELTPRALGALLALYEHRVFCSAAVWGINAFDQWGVELGKALCGALLPRLASGDARGLDASTAGLLARLRG